MGAGGRGGRGGARPGWGSGARIRRRAGNGWRTGTSRRPGDRWTARRHVGEGDRVVGEQGRVLHLALSLGEKPGVAITGAGRRELPVELGHAVGDGAHSYCPNLELLLTCRRVTQLTVGQRQMPTQRGDLPGALWPVIACLILEY